MASHGMLEEINEDTWAATNISKALSLPGLKAGVNHKYARYKIATSYYSVLGQH